MQKNIFLNAGHDINDPGKITEYGIEAELNRRIRNEVLIGLEKQGFKVFGVPDELGLKDSIKWVNERAKKIDEGLALDIHLNCCQGNGVEVYYGESAFTKKIAWILANEYSKEMAMINRGAKPDSQSQYKRLAWIWDTNCYALLIECGYLDNKNDVEKIKDFPKTAQAIVKGICKIYEVDYKEEILLKKRSREEIKQEIIKLLKEL